MKKILKKLLTVLPMLAVGFACGILLGSYEARATEAGLPGGTPGAMALLFVGFLLALYVQIAVHEAGHLVFGLITGYQFRSFRLGSLMVVREDGRLRLARLKIAGTAGQCLMAPPPWQDGLPVFLYNLGGCLMNLLASILCLLAWLPLREHWLGALPLVTALLGLGMAFANGIPMGVGGVDNDGRNARNLQKDPAARRAFWVQLKVSEAQAQGLRLYQMPQEWFIPPEGSLDNPLVATLAVFSCNRLMDQQQFSHARRAMEELLARKTGMLGLYRNLLTCDLICCCLLEGDRDRAASLVTGELRSFLKSMKTYPSVIRTEYFLAVLDRQDAAAAQKLRATFEWAATRYPYPAEIDSERELLDLADRQEVAAL